jgi:hypothetical protein
MQNIIKHCQPLNQQLIDSLMKPINLLKSLIYLIIIIECNTFLLSTFKLFIHIIGYFLYIKSDV